jgi:hypothetical protein
MFFESDLSQQRLGRQSGLKMASKMLNTTIDKEFRENYLRMRQEAIEGGIRPEKVDEFLQSLKQDTQLWAINRFKERLQQRLSQTTIRRLGAIKSAANEKKNGQSQKRCVNS